MTIIVYDYASDRILVDSLRTIQGSFKAVEVHLL